MLVTSGYTGAPPDGWRFSVSAKGVRVSPAWFSALIALAIAVCGLASWGLRWAWRILRQVGHFLDAFFGEPARDGLPARPGVMARLGSIEETVAKVVAETTPNSGKSLRDAVGRIESDVTLIKTDQGELRRRMELFEHQRSSREDSV